MYYSKDAESFGTGLKRITEKCNEAGTNFKFKMLKSGFVVVFYRHSEELSKGKIVTNVTLEQKGSNEDIIIEYIRENGSVNTSIVMKICGYKSRTGAQKTLNKLVKLGLIIKVGKGPSTKYILS